MTTTVVYSGTDDCNMYCGDTTATATVGQYCLDGTGTTQTVDSTSTSSKVGTRRANISDKFRTEQLYFVMDTWSIGTDQVVTDAEFSFALQSTSSPGAFTLELYAMDVGGVFSEFWIDQSEMASIGVMATHDLPTYNTLYTYYTMVNTDTAKAAASVDLVNSSAYTMASSLNRTLTGTTYLSEATSDKKAGVYMAEAGGTVYDPYLTVTHEDAQGAVQFGCNF